MRFSLSAHGRKLTQFASFILLVAFILQPLDSVFVSIFKLSRVDDWTRWLVAILCGDHSRIYSGNSLYALPPSARFIKDKATGYVT